MGRIIDYPEISNFTDEDYLVVDGSEGGTRKILGQAVKGVVDSTPTEDSQNAVSSGGVWNSLNDISEEFQSLRSDAYDVYPKKKLTADVVQFDDGAENVPVSEMTAYIYPSMSGSGMPSRTNVRTISGSNSVNVYHANKNLIAPLTYQDAPETVYLGVENSENLLIFFKAGDYRISVKMRDNSAIVPYWVTSGGTPQRSETMHLDADSEVSIYLYDENGVATIDIESFQVEVGIYATDNETYDGEVTNVAFPSGQGDIYLGRVNPVEGKLLVDAIIYERNSSTMNNNENKPGWSYTGLQSYNVKVGTFDTVVYWPDGTVRFTPVNVGSAYSIEFENDDYNVILPVDSYGMTQSQWISLGINIQILVTLSTPIEVDIDPIEFRTFYKNNTYFTNSGKLDVEYRLDLAAYVDNQTDVSDKIEKAFATDTASGAVATFTDGADDIPVKSCVVAIEPVQDLHGQEAPYPAGGGKNKLPLTVEGIKALNPSREGTWDGNSYTRLGITYNLVTDSDGNIIRIHVSGTRTGASYLDLARISSIPYGTYIISGGASGVGVRAYHFDGTRIATSTGSVETQFTSTEDAGNNTFDVTIASDNEVNVDIYPMVRLASESDSTFAPYSNICPISGWTGASVVRAGKNLYNYDETKLQLVTTNTGSTRSCMRTGLFDGTYSFSGYVIDSSQVGITNINIGKLKNGIATIFNSFISPTSITQRTFTVEADEEIILMASSESTYTLKHTLPLYNIQIEKRNTITEYEPYQSNTYSITFPTSAGTVYGGELDVTNGELTVDRAMVDLGTLNWSYVEANTMFISPAFTPPMATRAEKKGVCSSYKQIYNPVINSKWTNGDKIFTLVYSDARIRLKDTSYTDATTFKTAVSGVQFCYELATPITYHLTPTEIKSLLGENNVWADCGNTEVTYRADTAMYIEKKLGKDAPMIATSNIVSGSYFMVGSNLYKATANIASGAAVVVGTNATAKTMAEALNEINA